MITDKFRVADRQETLQMTFELPFNRNPAPITVEKNEKFLFPVPLPINIPPGLPAFYGWLDVESLKYYKQGQELYPKVSAHYRGVFNIGRPIKMEINNDLGQKYSIFFTSFWHNQIVENVAPPFSSDPPQESAVYNFKIFVPQLLQSLQPEEMNGYRFELELKDNQDRFASFAISPNGECFEAKISAQYVDINHLAYGCKLRLTYQLIEVWAESF